MKENGIRKKLEYALEPMGGDVVPLIAALGCGSLSIIEYIGGNHDTSAEFLKASGGFAVAYLVFTPLRYLDNQGKIG